MIPLLAALACLACQEEKPDPLKAQAWKPPTWEVVATTTESYRFRQDLDDAPGDVSVAHYKLSTDVNWTPGMRDLFRFNGGVDYLHYDFSSDAAFLPGVADLFEDMYILRLEGTYMRVFDETWTGIGYLSIYDLFEEGATMKDGLSLGVAAGALYRSGQDLSIGMVLRVQQRIEDDPYVFPLPLIDWNITPELALKTEIRVGFGYYLTYTLDEEKRWAAETRGYYILRRYRLDHGNMPDEGVVEDQRVPWDVGLRYTVKGAWSASLHVGVDLWQQYEISDKRGRHSEEIETEPAFFLIAGVSLTF